jgi:hypothetical protein
VAVGADQFDWQGQNTVCTLLKTCMTIFQGEWEESIKSMDEAVNAMPRTNHRLLIFKHRVVIKAKLGRSVQMDIQKFRVSKFGYM